MSDSILCQAKLTDDHYRALKLWSVGHDRKLSETADLAFSEFESLRKRSLPQKPLYILPLQGSRPRSFWLPPSLINRLKAVAEDDDVPLKAVFLLALYHFITSKVLSEPHS